MSSSSSEKSINFSLKRVHLSSYHNLHDPTFLLFNARSHEASSRCRSCRIDIDNLYFRGAFQSLALVTGSRTITSDQTVYSKFVFFLKFIGTSLDRNYRGAINLLSVLPELYFNILRTEKIWQFSWIQILCVCLIRFLTSCAGSWFADHNE